MKKYTRKPRLNKNTIRKIMNGAIEEYEYWTLGPKGLYEFEVDEND